ncbi:hypothetical protein [Planctobacterium marinum]|uniref:hypothetical protein n=1 Tax=Planctobacterium marinum TaxID=1631968 RepID=UPI001E2926B3|nr:hypothetical protein [Planctobacterium marinum]MCC2605706.1 hypothetical protein [Planctobacterium marinum]
MNITGNNQIQNNYAAEKHKDIKDGSLTSGTSLAEKVTISSDGKNAMAQMNSIATQYDVNDISQKERGEMANKLMEKGIISTGVGMHIVAPTSMTERPEDRSDFLSGMQESLKVDRNPIDSEHMKNKLKAIAVLDELKSMRPG